MKCSLCQKEAIDSFITETGNNAEISVVVNLCQSHFDEWDNAELVFEGRYAEELLELTQNSI